MPGSMHGFDTRNSGIPIIVQAPPPAGSAAVRGVENDVGSRRVGKGVANKT
jgi:hypothetical protein